MLFKPGNCPRDYKILTATIILACLLTMTLPNHASAQTGGNFDINVSQYFDKPVSQREFLELSREELQTIVARLSGKSFEIEGFDVPASETLVQFAAVNRIKVKRWFKRMARLKPRQERRDYLREEYHKIVRNSDEIRASIIAWKRKKKSLVRDLAISAEENRLDGYSSGKWFLVYWRQNYRFGPIKK